MTQPSWPPPTTTYTSSWGFLGGAGQSRMNREATTGRLPHPANTNTGRLWLISTAEGVLALLLIWADSQDVGKQRDDTDVN